VAVQGLPCTSANALYGRLFRLQPLRQDAELLRRRPSSRTATRKYAEAVARTEHLPANGHLIITAFAASRAAAPKHLTCVINGIERFG